MSENRRIDFFCIIAQSDDGKIDMVDEVFTQRPDDEIIDRYCENYSKVRVVQFALRVSLGIEEVITTK